MIFDKNRLDDLKLARDAAVSAGEVSFVFEGVEILVAYAKYLIEYLEGKFK